LRGKNSIPFSTHPPSNIHSSLPPSSIPLSILSFFHAIAEINIVQPGKAEKTNKKQQKQEPKWKKSSRDKQLGVIR